MKKYIVLSAISLASFSSSFCQIGQDVEENCYLYRIPKMAEEELSKGNDVMDKFLTDEDVSKEEIAHLKKCWEHLLLLKKIYELRERR